MTYMYVLYYAFDTLTHSHAVDNAHIQPESHVHEHT